MTGERPRERPGERPRLTMRATTSLAHRLGAPLPVGELLPLAIQLTAALAAIHARGQVHGDLRPSAIAVDAASGEIVLDSERPPGLNAAALLESALPYMAPEQTGQMNRPVDGRSDLYTLGVILYQLLAGRLPFEADDAIGWAHAHVARQPRPLAQLHPSLPRPLVDLVHRLLAKPPDHRYQSAAGLRHDLERCLRQWSERGEIAPFSLGERDVSDELRIPQRLYGRDAESAAMHEAFDRVAASGTPELVLLSGYAGIGKSSVVRELLRPVVRRRGRFIAGKFEQYKRDIPYLTVSQALGALALDLLAEGEERLARWRPRIAEVLGESGKLIVDLVPQLGLIVGPKPPVPELSLIEGEARLRRLFGRLFAACATAEHPLVMFVDDLQWADRASLDLIAHLLTDGDPRHLLIIGAYRDNEIGPAHPVVRALEVVRRSGAPVREFELGPLTEDDVVHLVADTVHASPAETAALATLVREKTGGNPFFAIQFLTTLYHKRAIWFDRDAARWRWDVARIRAEGYTDNLAELMRGRLYALPEATQAALQLTACLGGTVDAAVLALAADHDLGPALRPALEQHLLLELVSGDRRVYRFPHDRVLEAAYALLPEPERARTHLVLGRRLLAATSLDELPERLFEIASQLDRALALGATIDAPDERERIAELFLTAGMRAQAATAFASALRHLAAGAAALGDEASRRPALAFALELHRAECEVLTGATDDAAPRLAALADRATSLVDLAAVTAARISLYSPRDRSPLAVEATLAYLRRAGVDWSAHPSDDDVQREYDRIWQQLGARPIEALFDLPLAAPEHRATMDVLTLVQAAALSVDGKLHTLVICRLVNMSLEHGNCDGSCIGYAWFGALLRARFGEPAAGYRFGQVGLELAERRGLRRWRARVYLDHGVLLTPWAKHLRTGLELVRRAFDAANEAGDTTFAAYACIARISLLLASGEPLPVVQREAEDGQAFVRKSRFVLAIDSIETQLQMIRSLRGLTRSFGSLDDHTVDEAQLEQRLVADPLLALAACLYWFRKVALRYLAGDLAGAMAAMDRARPARSVAAAFSETADYAYYAALVCAARHDAAPEDERPRLLEAVVAHHAELAVWAEQCPESFASRAALAGAELARLRGRDDEALRGYEQAVRAARAHGFVQHEATAYEAAARLHRARGEALLADAFVEQAHARYLRWGADAKARQLRDAHPGLGLDAPGAAAGTHLVQLDQLSVIKASQTISGVMDQDLLSRTLLRFVLEEGGARRGVLALAHGGKLELAAEVRAEGAPPHRGDARAPWSLLAYVQRTGEPALLDASLDGGRFAADPYFEVARPCSALCLPVRLRAEAIALLYLENDLVPGVFTPERLAALQLLAAQAAISLENARLLERERARRLEAEAAERRQLLLGAVTALLSQALDGGDLSAVLTRLCAGSFIDWAVLDLVEGGALAPRAAAHRDPAREPLLRELTARSPPRPGATTLGWDVPPAGTPGELPILTLDQLLARCADEHHAELLRRLGLRSAIVIPLYVRDAVIGALTLATAAPPSRFTRPDLELAIELGRRMTLALDNARLLAETRRALHQREEFLRIASHELRTPLASLRLSAQALLRAAERKRAVPPEIVDKSLRRMLGNTLRLEQLTAELLDVTRIEQGRLALSVADIALDAIVRQAVDQLEPDLLAAGTPVTIDCPAPIYGRWDPSRLDQVVTNLVVNASKFGPGKPIAIRLDRAGDTARLVVTDHGIGIDPARQPFIFDRFERAVPSSSYGGLGLGLYIARSIVLAHGGAITVESEPGVGSTFTITLPCAAPQRALDPAPI